MTKREGIPLYLSRTSTVLNNLIADAEAEGAHVCSFFYFMRAPCIGEGGKTSLHAPFVLLPLFLPTLFRLFSHVASQKAPCTARKAPRGLS